MIVLDTHVWLWWLAQPDRLSPGARQAIDGASRIGVCTLSALEVAMLAVRGRVSLDRDVSAWVRQAFAAPRVEALAPSADIAVAAALLDRDAFPGDPVDRIIYATARASRARLVTRDRAIRAFDRRTAVW
ncbi:MAG: type II toxin-antitoxin system VapC family toxin [Solirubrobacteraceae bacterium]|nr:type II toxin-antitoxin system VapC family toxin [Solirubrobacteraceae bacterium]